MICRGGGRLFQQRVGGLEQNGRVVKSHVLYPSELPWPFEPRGGLEPPTTSLSAISDLRESVLFKCDGRVGRNRITSEQDNRKLGVRHDGVVTRVAFESK
jgi:hypothetical protein